MAKKKKRMVVYVLSHYPLRVYMCDWFQSGEEPEALRLVLRIWPSRTRKRTRNGHRRSEPDDKPRRSRSKRKPAERRCVCVHVCDQIHLYLF